jgi:hypothetical protein
VSRRPLVGSRLAVSLNTSSPIFRSNKSTGAGGHPCFNRETRPVDWATHAQGLQPYGPGWTGLARIPLAAAPRTAHHGRACSVGASTARPQSGATEAMNCSALRRLKPVDETQRCLHQAPRSGDRPRDRRTAAPLTQVVGALTGYVPIRRRVLGIVISGHADVRADAHRTAWAMWRGSGVIALGGRIGEERRCRRRRRSAGARL